jgi:hypothetical protein
MTLFFFVTPMERRKDVIHEICIFHAVFLTCSDSPLLKQLGRLPKEEKKEPEGKLSVGKKKVGRVDTDKGSREEIEGEGTDTTRDCVHDRVCVLSHNICSDSSSEEGDETRRENKERTTERVRHRVPLLLFRLHPFTFSMVCISMSP